MHIILYVLDALRPDHMGCYGYRRETTPHIDRLAAEGIVFDNCFTSTTWTRPVAASILTGAYPGVHQTRTRQDRFSDELWRLPQALKEAGYRTAAFSTMGNVASEVGFDHGFDHFCELFREPAVIARRKKLNAAKEGLLHAADESVALPRAEDINDFLLPWLGDNRNEATFSFVWSIEPHEPYDPPPSFRRYAGPPSRREEGWSDDIRSAGRQDRRRLMNLYDDGIHYNDHCLGQLVQELKRQGLYKDTCWLIVGDHGEAFYEHGFYTHGHPPYEELIRVPLIIRLPGGQFAGQRVAALAELVDLFPTIMGLVGQELPEPVKAFVQGQNLMPLVANEIQQVRPYAFSDTQSLSIHNHYLSVRSHEWKYIQIRRPQRDGQTLWKTVLHILERGMLLDILRRPAHFWRSFFRKDENELLFDLLADPAEQDNQAKRRPELARQFSQILEEWLEQNEYLAQQVAVETMSYQESEGLQRHLEALGYL